jgi:hypothetical protein
MCPIRIAAAVLAAAKVTSTAGVSTIALKKLGYKNSVAASSPSKEIHHG